MNTSLQTAGWYLSGAERHPVFCTPFTIGRRPDCNLRLNSVNVSRQHAALIVAGELVFLQDIDSRNGTFVNGYRTKDITPIGVGDLVQFGDMKFEIGRESAGQGSVTRSLDLIPGDALLAQMNEILEHQNFRMVYQPIVTADEHQLFGVEALLRCDVPGWESPVKLFQSAVRLGLEEQLSTGCRAKAVETIAPYNRSQRLFLNTHPNEFLGGGLLESLEELRGLAGQWNLVVEIHESAVPDLKTIESFRTAVHDLNIELAYDDFGAGQRRLQEISEVPPDYVKFDRALVDGIANEDTRQQNLLRSLVELCRNNGIKTIAEGLDNELDGEFCHELGFDLFQGYFYGKPSDSQVLFTEN